MPSPISIHRLRDVADAARLEPGIDAVFVQSSNTQTFASDASRSAFRERWLGRYLLFDTDWAYVALSSDGAVAGYLVASLDDPAQTPRFDDTAYFAEFANLTRRFPAHLHVNLAPEHRSEGIGSWLIARLIDDARKTGVPGVHVVTSRGARNVAFYARNGFTERGATGEGDREIVFLGREMAP